MIRDTITTIVRRTRERPLLIGALAILLALLVGVSTYMLASSGSSSSAESSDREILYWYDPMVPQEHYPGPGKSSMGMELIPKYADEGEDGGVRVSPAMMQNLGVRVVRAQTRAIAPTVPAVGRVELDERLVSEVQTLTPGFVETLAVRAEGEPVSRGSRIATVYSPELYGAEQEYAALVKMRGSAITPGLREAAANRLRLLGLPAGAIQRLSRGAAPQRTYPVFAPRSGIVSKIGARPGAQVTPGQSIVTIAGLSRVLVVAEVPEASLGDIHVGLPVKISFPAYPGEFREGRVDYIYPKLDPQSRTARVRITLDNPRGRLREGMFANIQNQGTGGTALVVPSEAVIDTGRRTIVVIRRNGTFMPVEVETGRDTGEWTQILSGLEPGAEVVASGQFLIDSEASLSGVMTRLNSGNTAAQKAAAQPAQATGKIVTMDTGAGKVTIAHGAMPAMNWPAMTMTFGLRDPAMLRGLKRGDRVAFAVGKQPQGGAYVIERIQRAPGQ
jgi:Cu(I)/Ag(I) efflux system membrane fusion protein